MVSRASSGAQEEENPPPSSVGPPLFAQPVINITVRIMQIKQVIFFIGPVPVFLFTIIFPPKASLFQALAGFPVPMADRFLIIQRHTRSRVCLSVYIIKAAVRINERRLYFIFHFPFVDMKVFHSSTLPRIKLFFGTSRESFFWTTTT